MGKVFYTTAIVLAAGLICYGLLGILGTATSNKFEIEDPIVEIEIGKLPPMAQAAAFEALETRKTQLAGESLLFTLLIVGSIAGLLLLLFFRKRFLRR